MSIDIYIDFFKWCSVINGFIIILSSIIFLFFPDYSYKNNKKFFLGSKEEFNKTIYTILLYYTMIVIIFNIVPYISLLLMG